MCRCAKMTLETMPKKNISTTELKHLSDLAHLSLAAPHLVKLKTSLTALIGYIGEVKKIKLEGIQPVAQVTGKVNEYRPDVITPSLTQTQALSGSPKPTHQGFFVVERVLH